MPTFTDPVIAPAVQTGDVYADQVYAGPSAGWSGFPPSVISYSAVQAISPDGNYGLVGASRASDSYNPGAQGTIGLGAFVLNDTTAPNKKSVYGGYFEARRVTGSGPTQGIENTTVNFGEVVSQVPTSTNSDGISECYRAAAGRPDVTSPTNNSSAFSVVNNGARFERGIIFGDTALQETFQGSSEPLNEAVSLATPHRLAWYKDGNRLSYLSGEEGVFRRVSDGVNYRVIFSRSRTSGNVQAGDILGALQFEYYDTSGRTIGGQIFSMRDIGSAVRTVVSGTNSGNAAIGLTIAQGGANAVSPSGDNVLSLGQPGLSWERVYATRIVYGASGVIDQTGSGSPQGVVSAPLGSTYRRTDAAAGTRFFVKESGGTGNTGWVAK